MAAYRRLRIAGSLLLSLGLLVGVVAGIGLLLGFEPARLPASLLNIAAYKLAFVAAGGLLAAGAMVARYARREASLDLRAKRAPEPAELREPDSLRGTELPARSTSNVRAHDSERDRLT